MPQFASESVTPDALPPIVLLVDHDRDMLDTYSACFENAGLWIATAADPDEGLAAVDELKPDLVVTDGYVGEQRGAAFVQALKHDADREPVPVIVLTGQPSDHVSPGISRDADLLLVKPVLPETLLTGVRQVIAVAHELRQRSERVFHRGRQQLETPSQLASESADISKRAEPVRRSCPRCGVSLKWSERGTIGGLQYDYYDWCRHGCGLFCYEANAQRWLKLA